MNRDPIRILTAVPICDGHDSAINTINLELVRNGIEVIYLGYHRPAGDVVRAAIQENVRAVGISSYNGGHVEYFALVRKGLDSAGGSDIGLFGGGGGTISPGDVKQMTRLGIDRIFLAGVPLGEMVEFVKEKYGTSKTLKRADLSDDRFTAQLVSGIIRRPAPALQDRPGHNRPFIVGISGPGGAGKTTLIDELVLRALNANATSRIAVLSHDPSIVSSGALLGDRAAMIWSQNDRVFMHSFATRGQGGGLSAQTNDAIAALRNSSFDYIFVETVGTGQEAMPFGDKLVDRSIFVMSPEYGSRLQLQKIAMLDLADIVVVNKSDRAGARTAATEVEQRLRSNRKSQRVVSTVAKQHRDGGVDALFAQLKTDVEEVGQKSRNEKVKA